MEKIKVNVQWPGANFGVSLGNNLPGAVVFTANTFEELQKKAAETLRFHVKGMLEDATMCPNGLSMATMTLSTLGGKVDWKI